MPRKTKPQPSIPELQALSDKQLDEREDQVIERQAALEAELVEISLEKVRRAVLAQFPEGKLVELQRDEDADELAYEYFQFRVAKVILKDGAEITPYDVDHIESLEAIEDTAADDLQYLEEHWARRKRDHEGYLTNQDEVFPILLA